VAERLAVWARLTALGGAWGVGMAWWYQASPWRGLAVGVGLWGASLFVAIRGPHAPVLEPLD
jgi:hypothetical protein